MRHFLNLFQMLKIILRNPCYYIYTSKQPPTTKNPKKERNVIIMRRSVKTAACICALIMAATSVSAVPAYADSTSQTSAAAQADTQKQKAKNVKIGKVTAVNGSEITLALGEYSKPDKPADNTAAGDSTAAAKKEKPEKQQKAKPSDSAASGSDTSADSASGTAKAKSGGRRGGRHKGGKSGEFTENGSTLTITLTDSISLKKSGKAVTAADISAGDILTLRYNGSGELVGINVSGEKTEKAKPESGTKTKGVRRDRKAGTEQAVTA